MRECLEKALKDCHAIVVGDVPLNIVPPTVLVTRDQSRDQALMKSLRELYGGADDNLAAQIAGAMGVPKEMLGNYEHEHIPDATMYAVSAQLGNTIRLQQELAVLKCLGVAETDGDLANLTFARRYGVSREMMEDDEIMGNQGTNEYNPCPVFEAVAILFEKDKKPRVVLPMTVFVCDNNCGGGGEEAKTLAIRAIPKEFEENIKDVKVFIRPFVG